MHRRQFLSVLSTTAAAWSLSPALADTFPTRPVRIVVPVAVGGSADKLARALGQKLGEAWNQRVLVENVAGASGTLGAALVAKAPADGHTLLLGGDSLSLQPLQVKHLPYDPLKDFVGVVKAVVNPQLLLVRPGLGIANWEQFVAWAKARPGHLSLGLPGGIGSPQHLAVQMLSQRAGISVNAVPYLGGGPVLVDMIGGHVDATLITLAAATEHVRSGKLIPIAVTTSYRSGALPQVPTLQEAGLAGFAVESWQGLVAPAATPAAVVQRIHRDAAAVLRHPDLERSLQAQGFVVSAGKPGDVDRTVLEDHRVYARVLASSGIKL